MSVLACDIGGTRIKLGIVRDGRVLIREVIDAHSERGLQERLPAIANAFRGLCKTAKIALGDCAGISISFPSLIDPKSGRVLAEYGKYRDAPQIDLRAWANEQFGLPMAIENDARMALIGEWRFGAGQAYEDAVMITLGTGIGVAALSEGRVLRGKHGQAAVLCGHATVRYGGRLCSCGNIGCAEAEASSAFLSQIAREREDFATSLLSQQPLLDYASVFQCAARGDGCAKAISDHSLQVWSSLAVNLIHTFDPELVILGGGIMASAEIILPAVQDYVRKHAHTPWGQVRVVASELGDEAALVAGEWLLQEQ